MRKKISAINKKRVELAKQYKGNAEVYGNLLFELSELVLCGHRDGWETCCVEFAMLVSPAC